MRGTLQNYFFYPLQTYLLHCFHEGRHWPRNNNNLVKITLKGRIGLRVRHEMNLEGNSVTSSLLKMLLYCHHHPCYSVHFVNLIKRNKSVSSIITSIICWKNEKRCDEDHVPSCYVLVLTPHLTKLQVVLYFFLYLLLFLLPSTTKKKWSNKTSSKFKGREKEDFLITSQYLNSPRKKE